MKKRSAKIVPSSLRVERFFDVRRYAAAEAFDAADWVAQLMFRRLVSQYIVEGVKANDINWIHLLGQMLERPFGNREFRGPMLYKENSRTVADLTVYDYWAARGEVERDEILKTACFQYTTALVNEDYTAEPEVCAKSMHEYRIENTQFERMRDEVWVTIDLGLSDEQISNDFAEWLTKKRVSLKAAGRAQPRPRAFSKSDFKDWCSKKAIAYIDLELLADALGGRFTDRVIGDLLFPDETDVDLTERVRKVVRPCARTLLEYRTLEILDAQAAKSRRDANRANQAPE